MRSGLSFGVRKNTRYVASLNFLYRRPSLPSRDHDAAIIRHHPVHPRSTRQTLSPLLRLVKTDPPSSKGPQAILPQRQPLTAWHSAYP